MQNTIIEILINENRFFDFNEVLFLFENENTEKYYNSYLKLNIFQSVI